IGGGFLVQRFHTHCHVAPVVAVHGNRQLALGLERQGEYVVREGEGVADLRSRQAVAGDDEETDASTGSTDLARHRHASLLITNLQRRNINEWNVIVHFNTLVPAKMPCFFAYGKQSWV